MQLRLLCVLLFTVQRIVQMYTGAENLKSSYFIFLKQNFLSIFRPFFILRKRSMITKLLVFKVFLHRSAETHFKNHFLDIQASVSRRPHSCVVQRWCLISVSFSGLLWEAVMFPLKRFPQKWNICCNTFNIYFYIFPICIDPASLG